MEFTAQYWWDCCSNCDFCWQRQVDRAYMFSNFIKPSKESMLLHNKLLLKTITNYYKTTKDIFNGIRVVFYGGELFHRADMKELYEGYENTIEVTNDIRELSKHHEKSTNIRMFSNLLFKNLNLIKYVIKLDSKINWRFSFDFNGRFRSNEQVDLFVNNLYEINKYLNRMPKLKITITKETIENFNPNSYEFKIFKDRLIKDFKITFDLYEIYNHVDEKWAKKYYVTANELRKWVEKLNKYLPVDLEVSGGRFRKTVILYN